MVTSLSTVAFPSPRSPSATHHRPWRSTTTTHKNKFLSKSTTHCRRPWTGLPGADVAVVVLCVVVAMLLPHQSHAYNRQMQVRRDYQRRGAAFPDELVEAPPVRDRADAEDYLQHFGYLNCSMSSSSTSSGRPSYRSRRKRHIVPHEISEGGSEEDMEEDDPCTDEEYTLALTRFQDAMALKMTGILDEPTKTAMMKGRCGNTDSLIVEETIQELEATDSKKSKDSTELKDDRPNRRDKSAPIKGRIKRDAVVESSHTSWILDPIWKWLVNKLPRGNSDSMAEIDRINNGFDEGRLGDFDERTSLYADDFTDMWDTDTDKSEYFTHLAIEGEENPYEDHDSSLLTQLISPHKRKKRNVRMEMLEEIEGIMTANYEERRKRDIATYEELKEQGKVIVDPLNPVRIKRNLHIHGESGVNYTDPEDTYNYQWNRKSLLYYRILESSQRIPPFRQCSLVTLAFRMWAEVTVLDFAPAPPNMENKDVDIWIAFGILNHLSCPIEFDGVGGVLAHSLFAPDKAHSNIHIDDAERFKHSPSPNGNGVPLLVILVHEVGHALGLNHHKHIQSVMFPVLGISFRDSFELTSYDRQAIQQIYGTCSGRFDAMFDYLFTVCSDPSDNCHVACGEPYQRWKYYSFFFRKHQYWIFLNKKGRPRYGDPKLFDFEWKGVPDNIDAVVQVTKSVNCTNFESSPTQYLMETLFFKGDLYYEYDNINKQVKENGTKKISERFGPKPGNRTTVPNNLDAVLFNPNEYLLYFFKGKWIWRVDPDMDPENGTCCHDRIRFSDVFIFNESTVNRTKHNYTDIPELRGNIDSIYLRWQKNQIYIFKDKYVWETRVQESPFYLKFLGPWNEIWKYICGVNIAPSTLMCT